MLFAELALFALVLESVIGYPDKLNKRIPHPVIWFGKLINLLDSKLNKKSDTASIQKRKGFVSHDSCLGCTFSRFCYPRFSLTF
jgi:adenosylcobinamide-phosphate synthase